MKVDKKVGVGIFAFVLLCVLPSIMHSQSVPEILQNPLAPFEQWLPIVGIAIMVSFAFAAILYMLGKFLNDQQISARGIAEFGQSIGTAIFVVLALGALLFFGSFISTSNILTGSISSDMSSICNGLTSSPGSQLTLLKANPTAQICSFVTSQQSGNADTSTYLNYGLASSYIIIANLTNQASENMNSLYEYEGFVGFLSTLASDPGLCEPATPPPIAIATNCALNPYLPRWFSVDILSIPYAGYNMISAMTRPLETQSVFIFYMLLTQLIVFFILISIWPFLLAAGIILRALPFTRSAGGLLMGLTLVVVIIVPLIVMIEYNALGHGVTLNQIAGNAAQIQDNVIYGLNNPVCNGALLMQCTSIQIDWGDGTTSLKGAATADILSHTYPLTQASVPYTITVDLTDQNNVAYSASESITIPQTTVAVETNSNPAFFLAKATINGNQVTICPSGAVGVCNAYDSLVPNFYVFPNIQTVINYNGCWPVNGNLYAEEVADSLKMAAIGIGAVFSFSGFVSQIPFVDTSIARCAPSGAISTVFQLMSIYGLMSVVGFMIPLINILIIISAIKNVSYIFGGDTDLAGLGKLV